MVEIILKVNIYSQLQPSQVMSGTMVAMDIGICSKTHVYHCMTASIHMKTHIVLHHKLVPVRLTLYILCPLEAPFQLLISWFPL